MAGIEDRTLIYPCRVKISLRGAVQGVGFRPFIFRLARELDLRGFVLNTSSGVVIEAEGERFQLDEFILRIPLEKPAIAFISGCEFSFLDPVGLTDFVIKQSDADAPKDALILPDIAVCSECLREMFDPTNRRYRYPFINCTHCGPRFTIIEALPYDRRLTSMREFDMCADCRREYKDPEDRRFHAQPNACPVCGPILTLCDAHGRVMALRDEALNAAAELVRRGSILALKGIGGFQLVVDAVNFDSIDLLRRRKSREERPFALMFPSLDQVRRYCVVSDFEARLLESMESPIVLLCKKADPEDRVIPAENVAPGNPTYGVMLPYSPLHHLLLSDLQLPVVATSANMAEEPIIIDDQEVFKKLSGIADYFLVHNRRIVRHADDSIVRVIRGREMVMRRARGYAPMPLQLSKNVSGHAVAVGGQLKNCLAYAKGDMIFTTQHIGDLSTAEAMHTFEQVYSDYQSLLDIRPTYMAADLHPDYLSTQFAQSQSTPLIQVQHHAAHIAACMAENQIEGELLGVSWDGAGLGHDHAVWGGEFFLVGDDRFEHAAQFDYFPLPGGDAAAKEPRRAALGVLYRLLGEKLFELNLPFMSSFKPGEIDILLQMLAKKINSPATSSVGRLFDAVAAILDLRQVMSYEGQAAMMLEWAVSGTESACYDFELRQGERLIVDWRPIISGVLDDRLKVGTSVIAAKFHNTLAQIIVAVAMRFALPRVVLSGGVFQNMVLLQQTIFRLEESGFKPYWHQRIPTNDGGIAVGQIMLADREMSSRLNR